MKDKIFGVLQRVGRSFMLPIAILPVAGLFLGIGGSFTNETMVKAYHLTGILGKGTLLNSFLTVLSRCGDIVFANLPLIFAIGVAIGMAKKEKEVAALSGAIAFFIMHTAISAMLDITDVAKTLPSGSTATVVGINSLQMGVFGGIVVGLGVAALHNRFYKIELPQVLSFFGGTRFVPIISAITYLFVGILMFFVWPTIQSGIYALGDLVRGSGYAGTWIYGIIERALIPFGLHHVFYLPFWQTGVGGKLEVGGKVIEGAQNIFFAQLADPHTTKFSVEATRFMAGKFPFMIFGLPGAALAMYKTARPEKKKIAGGLLLSAAITAMLTGITEPIEFTFLFVAPLLYVVHSILAGLSFMLMHIFHVGVGMTFSGGLIDLTLFGILQGNAKTNWIWVVIVGIVYFVVYYFLFSFLIKKFNYKTPGREDDTEETKLYTRKDLNEAKANAASKGSNADDSETVSKLITEGLGGADNISDLDCCATRLRCTVKNSDLVKEDVLKQSGAAGVIKKGQGVQVIYGPRVSVIKSNLEDYLGK
ncbi:PTS transporter subunit EIIC [Anaeromicropila herbilytica]|uniref:PTS glucose transporter subunit IIB n=1 Tax=Anaeromicropila herbilytica TaxID=2785025 RepID=A0A7R7ELZ9_9FIRM|nr:PTS transporter subunit EIIC [Anaeromicropila herbilytica]BCN31335.1 PTS glucose transporter subunit IIB [Anaeromicropila herbilytica]